MHTNHSAVPDVSVVTPSLNQLEWLKLCAGSVADQEGVCFEHLVQDAGTGVELQRWAVARRNLQLFTERDDGMYDAVNRGLRRARGEICSYLNCDEQYLPGALAKVATFFRDHPDVDVLFGDAVVTDAGGRPTCYRRTVLPQLCHTRLAPLATLTCATFFRRSILRQGHWFDTAWKAIGDAVWIHGLLKAGVPMAVLPEPLATFTLTGTNLGQSQSCKDELNRWCRQPDAPPLWMELPVVMHYRVRKLLAGGYARRSLEMDLYSPQSPVARRHWTIERLNNYWSRSGA